MSQQLYWRLLAASASAYLCVACGNSEEHKPDSQLGDAAVDSGSQDLVDSGFDAPGNDAGDGDSLGSGAGDGGDGSDSDAGQPLADAGQLEDDIPDGLNIVKMIAPSVCDVENSLLYNCRFGPIALDAPEVPLEGRYKTRVIGHHKGDCTTQYRVVAKLSAEGVDPFIYNIFENDEVSLRRDDDEALASILVEEGSGIPGQQDYDLTCRIWLEVVFNEAIEEP